MNHKIVALIIAFAIVSSAATYLLAFADLFSAPESEIVCPEDGSPYVRTPIGTRSENFLWMCLRCGYSWRKTYPEDAYQGWRNGFLEPSFVRGYTLLYLMNVLELNVSDPLALDWTGGRETPEGLLGSETYVYQADDIVVTIRYPVVLPENTVYEVKVEVKCATLWEGKLHRRQFLSSAYTPPGGSEFRPIYDYYGGLGLFERGIHIIATSVDPVALWNAAEFKTVNDYWELLKENETLKASTKEFMSIIISRGDHPTGGYTIKVKSFTWVETCPTIFLFAVNFTDPGEGVIVTEAFTNPQVLVPIGRLSPGKYIVEVHVDHFTLTYDASGKPVYTPVQTFAEEVWRQSFEILEE